MEQKIEELQKRIADLGEELKKTSITEYQKDYLYLELEYSRQKYAKLRKEESEYEENAAGSGHIREKGFKSK